MLRLHDYNETIFDKGCVAYLGNAVEVKLEKKINDIECVYFEYPYLDEKAAMIEENMIVSCEGQGYVILKNTRKTDGKDMKSITAADLFSTYGQSKFIENIPDMIGKKPSVIFKKILEGSQFTAFTEAELNERGMTWVDSDGYLIDFFSLDKTNVWDATRTLIENCGKGEIYRDNFKVAIVKRLGTDNGVRLTLEKNLDGLEIMHDFEHIITRLYPYGSDDMHNDIDKIFKIVASYCKNNLVFDMDGIKIDNDLIATERDIDYLQQQIDILKKRLDAMS